MKKKSRLLSMICITALLISACAGRKESFSPTSEPQKIAADDSAAGTEMDYAENAAEEESLPEAKAEEASEDSGVNTDKPQDNTQKTELPTEEKLVYSCNISMETLEFDKTYDQIYKLLEKYDGIVEGEEFRSNDYYDYGYGSMPQKRSVGNRFCTITLRVPSKSYREFVAKVSEEGNVTYKNATVQNMTREYNDSTSYVNGLKEQLNRLNEMMAQTDKVEDMIAINAEITSVQNEINSYMTHIRAMDADVALSTIILELSEVSEYSEEDEIVKVGTFGDRLKNALSGSFSRFLSFLEGLLFVIIYLLPFLILLGVIVFIIVIIVKKVKKSIGRKKMRKPAGGQAEISSQIQESNHHEHPSDNSPHFK